MFVLLSVIDLLVLMTGATDSFSGPRRSEEAGRPLILTPFLKDNRISEAKDAAKVPSFLQKESQITSYSGYLTVNEEYDSNLFFWLFPSLKEPQTAPFVLWIGGTPGIASSLDVFLKNGPYVVNGPQCDCECESVLPTVSAAVYHWSDIMHVLYLDSPVGAGFSFTRNSSGLARTEADVIDDLYTALVQVVQLFPEYSKNDFFIAGESYAAKYAASLAHSIHLKNLQAAVKINLNGIILGNSWWDPLNMLDFSEVLYDVGLVDLATKEEFSGMEEEIKSLIVNESFAEAFDALQKYFPLTISSKSLVHNVTGFSYLGNYMHIDNKAQDTYLTSVGRFLNQPEIKKKLHVGRGSFAVNNHEVFSLLKFDLLRSVTHKMSEVMNNYRVLMYSGQLDVACAYRLMTNALRQMNWDGADEYSKAGRKKWYVESQLAGYVKTAGNFTEVLVREAGMDVQQDQQLWAWALVKRFVQKLPFAE